MKGRTDLRMKTKSLVREQFQGFVLGGSKTKMIQPTGLITTERRRNRSAATRWETLDFSKSVLAERGSPGQIWRQRCASNGSGSLYISTTESLALTLLLLFCLTAF